VTLAIQYVGLHAVCDTCNTVCGKSTLFVALAIYYVETASVLGTCNTICGDCTLFLELVIQYADIAGIVALVAIELLQLLQSDSCTCNTNVETARCSCDT
jgi:hypothetical protein